MIREQESRIRERRARIREQRSGGLRARVAVLAALCVLCSAQPAPAQESPGTPGADVDFPIVYVRWPDAPAAAGGEAVGGGAYAVRRGAELLLRSPDGSERVLAGCDACAVQSPVVSFDGSTVYYTKIDNVADPHSASLIYKMRIAGPAADFREIQLTFDEGFDSGLHRAIEPGSRDDLGRWFSVRDQSPAPLPDGRVVFSSNRAAEMLPGKVRDAVLQNVGVDLWIVDDHDGDRRTAVETNLRRFHRGAQGNSRHPLVLEDGRILFQQGAGAGQLYTIDADGGRAAPFGGRVNGSGVTGLSMTQLADGSLLAIPFSPDFRIGSRKLRAARSAGLEPLSLELDGSGSPALWAGALATPSAAPGGVLVAFRSSDADSNMGLWLTERTTRVDSDEAEPLRLAMKDGFQMAWPRAVVPYAAIYGSEQPRAPSRMLADAAEAAAWIGDTALELEGISKADLQAVRVLAIVPRPFREPVKDSSSGRPRVAGFRSVHGQSWKLLGEMPLRSEEGGDASAALGFIARIPARTPYLVQLLGRGGKVLHTMPAASAAEAGENRIRGRTLSEVETLSLRTEQDGVWDLTRVTPRLDWSASARPSVKVDERPSVDVEFRRDILPALRTLRSDVRLGDYDRIVATVTDSKPAAQTRVSDETSFQDELQALRKSPESAALLSLWVALGCPFDGDTVEHEGFRYTDDCSLPVLALGFGDADLETLTVSALDLESGIDWQSLQLSVETFGARSESRVVTAKELEIDARQASTSLEIGGLLNKADGVVVVASLRDLSGNQTVESLRLQWASPGLLSDRTVPEQERESVGSSQESGSAARTASVALAGTSASASSEPSSAGEVRDSASVSSADANTSQAEPVAPRYSMEAVIDAADVPGVPVLAMALFDLSSGSAPEQEPPVLVDSHGGVGNGDGGGAEDVDSSGGSGPSGSPDVNLPSGSDGNVAVASRSESRYGCSAHRSGSPSAVLILLLPFAVGILRRRRQLLASAA